MLIGYRKTVTTLLLLLLFGWALPVGAEEKVQTPGKVAKVGNLFITLEDVYMRAQKIMPMQASFHGGVSAEKIASIKEQAFDELVERAYKVQYAIDEEISVDAATFSNEWQKKLNNNKTLANNPQSPQYSKIKADLYLDMLAMKAESVAVNDKIDVTDKQVADYYAQNKPMYYRPKLYTASHVFVRVDPASNAEELGVRKARAEELYKRAQAGEDFYNLAYYESDDRSKYVGGSLGAFHAGQTVSEFDAAIQDMKAGEIAGPVRTMYGFHIIKLDKVDDERQLEFDEVSTKIRSSIQESMRKELYEQWISGLKDKYLFERFDKKL